MNFFKRIINPGKTEELVTVEFTRDAFANGIGYSAGDTAALPRKTVTELLSAGAAIDHAANEAAVEHRKKMSELIPPPVDQLPLPESWGDLPPDFSTWWKLNEELSALCKRRSEIWKRLAAASRTYVLEDLNAFAAEYSRGNSANRPKLANALTAAVVGEIPQAHFDAINTLADAFERAAGAVTDWKDRHLDDLTRAKFKCGKYLEKKHGATCRAISELHRLARDLFAGRIAPLGLAERKVEELFHGSADWQRFATIDKPTLGDLHLAWSDGGSNPVYFVEKEVTAMVSIIRDFERMDTEVERLTKQAKAEMKKATAAAAA